MSILHTSVGKSRVFVAMGLLLTSLLCLSATLPAQTTISTGSIQGTITDPSGAVVHLAKVISSNRDTGQSIEATTSSAGTYSSGALMPRTYTVRVELKGFRVSELRMPVSVG